MRAYATPAQYTAAVAGDTATERELGLASLLIDAALQGAVYVVDAAGYPTDPAVLLALQEATVAVVEASHPKAAGAGIPGLKAATIGGVRYELEAAAASSNPGQLPQAARQLLINAGLGRGTVWVRG